MAHDVITILGIGVLAGAGGGLVVFLVWWAIYQVIELFRELGK